MFKGFLLNTKPNHSLSISTNYDIEPVSEMVSILIDMEDDFYTINREHMVAMTEAFQDELYADEILIESMTDVGESIKNFFKKLIEKVKAFFKKALMFIQAYVGDFSKFIKKYENELRLKNVDFEIQGYKYTFDIGVPASDDIINSALDSFNSEISSIDTLTKGEIIEKRKNRMKDSNKDKVRGKLLGKTSIADVDFSKTLIEMFRNGEDSDSNITIGQSELVEAMSNYTDNRKMLTKVSKERDKTIGLLSNLQSFFNRGADMFNTNANGKHLRASTLDRPSDSYKLNKTNVNVSYNTQNLTKVNLMYNAHFAYAKFITSIITTSMAAKIKALKESLAQDKKIIREALKKSNLVKDGE